MENGILFEFRRKNQLKVGVPHIFFRPLDPFHSCIQSVISTAQISLHFGVLGTEIGLVPHSSGCVNAGTLVRGLCATVSLNEKAPPGTKDGQTKST
jgi:hypothetical protein